MTHTLRIFLLLTPVIFLSSCMKLDSEITVSSTGSAHTRANIDMSGMAKLIASFGSGNVSTGSGSNMSTDLCKDNNFQDGLSGSMSKNQEDIKNLTCTTLGDYKARIEGDMDIQEKKGILFLSGVTVIDILTLSDSERSPVGADRGEEGGPSAESLGISFSQTVTLPGNIVYKDAGTLSGSSTILVNLLDPKILNKRSLIVIATQEGTSLTRKEINTYKLLLRKHNRSVKK